MTTTIRYEGTLIMKGFKLLFKGLIEVAQENAQRYRIGHVSRYLKIVTAVLKDFG